MHVKTLKNIAAVACVAALAVPAGVAAKGPGEHGKSGTKVGSQNHTSKRCKKQPGVGFNVVGKVVSYNAGTNTLVVDVESVSRHAKKYLTEDPLTVTGAKVPTPAPAVGSTVKVHGKITKPKKKCPMSDADIKASVKYTKVTPHSDEEETTTTTTSTPAPVQAA
jgi:hypothetical protein